MGPTLISLAHRRTLAWTQTTSKQQHEWLRRQCGGSITRVLSRRAARLVCAYVQVVRPMHVLACLRQSERVSRDDTCYLAFGRRGRLSGRRLRDAWASEWSMFASGCAMARSPPPRLTFGTYRHVAIALQTGVFLPRATESAVLRASEMVSIGRGGKVGHGEGGAQGRVVGNQNRGGGAQRVCCVKKKGAWNEAA